MLNHHRQDFNENMVILIGLKQFLKEKIETSFNSISNDAKSSEVNKGAYVCREERIDLSLPRGGSAIDGKAISIAYDLEKLNLHWNTLQKNKIFTSSCYTYNSWHRLRSYKGSHYNR